MFIILCHLLLPKQQKKGEEGVLVVSNLNLGGLIGLTTTLGHIPSGPNLSDTRIQANMYLFFQDTAGNVSEAYLGRIRIRYISDTDTPPPRSIHVTESVPILSLPANIYL